MNIDNLTYGEIKQLRSLFSAPESTTCNNGLTSMIGKKVIVRTYSCGVHFGELIEKSLK